MLARLAAIVTAATALVALAGAQPAFAGPYAPSGEMAVSTTSPVPGGSLAVSGDGFEAGSQVRVVMFSEPVVLGATAANAAGEVELTVEIPSSFAPGTTHTLEMQGVSPSGEVRVLTQQITLEAAGNDAGDDVGLAATGFAGSQIAILAGALLLGGGVLFVVGRTRRRTNQG